MNKNFENLIPDKQSNWKAKTEYRLKNREFINGQGKIITSWLIEMRSKNITKLDISNELNIPVEIVNGIFKCEIKMEYCLFNKIQTFLYINK